MRLSQPIYIGNFPLHQTEAYDDRCSRRTAYNRRPTNDPAVMAYRAELEKRGMLTAKSVPPKRRGTKDHCARGHANIAENRYTKLDGRSQCKLCQKERTAKMHIRSGANARKDAMPNYGKRANRGS